MKTLLRNTIVHASALYLLPYLFSGVSISGGFTTLLIGGVLLTIMGFTIKPIMEILSFPFNLLTMGLFSILTNVIILYLLTVMLPKISIQGFVFEGMRFIGFVIPRVDINTFFAYVLCAILIASVISLFNWIIR